MVYETVKVVNGYKIKKYAGQCGAYFVSIPSDDGIGWKEFFTFKTIKAATEFLETAYPA